MFHKYLQDKHRWDASTISDVDWAAFQRATARYQTSETHLLKLVHNKLPTRSETAKVNPHTSDQCHYCPERETFDHLLRCGNPQSHNFRKDLTDSLDSYFARSNTPPAFTHAFHSALQDWLQHPPLTPHNTRSQGNSVCTKAQDKIGRHLMLRGFLTIAWRRLYKTETQRKHPSPKTDPSDFLCGLIKVMWQAQTKFWENHLQTIHNNHNNNPSPGQLEKALEYKTKITYLHEKKHLCLHAHREHYFYTDVEEFLNTATISQMRQYLHHYENAIYQSIKDAKNTPTKSIFTFEGFTRGAVNPTKQPHQHIITQTRDLHTRKHTRWKKTTQATTSIRHFFTPLTSKHLPP